jgi:(4S)-4-hydroxy-5-phosphonooxypentane-2,3-dione isomerase
MLALIVDIRIHAAHIDAFAAAMAANAQASLALESGCRRFDICRDPADAALFFLYELYDDEAAIHAHLQSAHFRAMDAATREWVAHKSVRRLRLVAA